MSISLRTKKAVSLLAALTLLSTAYIAPAAGSSRWPSAQSDTAAVGSVQVTQIAPGTTSGRGLLEWPAVAGATEYRIYKTGTIRPTWRLVFVVVGTANSRKVVDKIGATAMYRVTALVSSRETPVGSFVYSPK
jgi:hypothetical protein